MEVPADKHPGITEPFGHQFHRAGDGETGKIGHHHLALVNQRVIGAHRYTESKRPQRLARDPGRPADLPSGADDHFDPVVQQFGQEVLWRADGCDKAELGV